MAKAVVLNSRIPRSVWCFSGLKVHQGSGLPRMIEGIVESCCVLLNLELSRALQHDSAGNAEFEPFVAIAAYSPLVIKL